MLAGDPRLATDIPPPGVAGEVRECSLDSMDPPWLAGEPPSPSDPWLEQLLATPDVGKSAPLPRGVIASPSSSKVVASISCSVLPARYICTRIHFFFRLNREGVTKENKEGRHMTKAHA